MIIYTSPNRFVKVNHLSSLSITIISYLAFFLYKIINFDIHRSRTDLESEFAVSFFVSTEGGMIMIIRLRKISCLKPSSGQTANKPFSWDILRCAADAQAMFIQH